MVEYEEIEKEGEKHTVYIRIIHTEDVNFITKIVKILTRNPRKPEQISSPALSVKIFKFAG